MPFVVLAGLAIVVGALIPVQAASNAAMSKAVGSVPFASLILFGESILIVALWLLITRPPAPSLAMVRGAPPYAFIGAVIVASYVLSITYLAPRLGVGNAICFIVTGQILGAVVVDHFGVFASAVVPFSVQRGIGLALMILGLFLAKKS